jgi:hypothetical protein
MSTQHETRDPQAEDQPYVASFEPAARFKPLFRIGNAVLTPILRSRLAARMPDLALLAFRGRKTGRRYTVPVGYHVVDDRGAVLTASGWKANLRGGADVEVTRGGEPRPMRALLVEDPDEVADVYLALLARVGAKRGTRVGVKVAGDRLPTHQEMVRAVGGRRAVVWLTPR